MGKKSCFDSQLLREFMAEFMGTAFLVAVGTGTSCTAVLSGGTAGSPATLALGWGLAVTFGVAISAGISGGHLNPAVSFAFTIFGDLPWYKFPFFVIAQFVGAFFGAAMTYMVYYDVFNKFDGGFRTVYGSNATASLFGTYPPEFVSTNSALLNEIFATCLLLMCVMAICDPKNLNIPKYMLPVMVGLVITAIMCSFCYTSGCAMNPARDLGPRLFTFIAGWGKEVFTFRNGNYFWVPLVGPMAGGPLGLFLYKVTIEFFWSGSGKRCVQNADTEIATQKITCDFHNGCCTAKDKIESVNL